MLMTTNYSINLEIGEDSDKNKSPKRMNALKNSFVRYQLYMRQAKNVN